MDQQYSEKNWGVTKINTLTVSYEWTIDNFSICGKKTEEFLQSPSFPSSNNYELKWYLRLFPNGKSEDSKDYISLYLYCDMDHPDIEVKANICFLKNKKEEINKVELIFHYTSIGGYGSPKFIKRDYLLKKVNNLLIDDKLIIRCYLKAGIGSENFANKVISTSQESICQEICNDITMLLDNKDLSDIMIVAKNGKEFHVHKAILAARSSVFCAMVKHDMKEKIESKIEILDTDYEILDEMLRYIYTGKVTNIQQFSDDLLVAADKYNLTGLKMQCEKYLCNNISTSNATKMLVLSDRYNCQMLKDEVVNFIIAHKKDVIESSEFKLLITSNPCLVINVLLAMTLDKN